MEGQIPELPSNKYKHRFLESIKEKWQKYLHILIPVIYKNPPQKMLFGQFWPNSQIGSSGPEKVNPVSAAKI